MIVRPNLLVSACLLASAVAAPARQPVAPDQPPPARYRRLFISPMGEPFRGDTTRDMVTVWFEGADLNHNGELTLAEFAADAARFFKTLDLDHDGAIAGPEVQRYEFDIVPEISGVVMEDEGFRDVPAGAPRRAAPHRESFQDDGGMGGGYGESEEPSGDSRPKKEPLEGAARFGLLNIPEPVISADTDFDGRVSWKEFESAAHLRFELLDTNRNSVLTLDEFPKLAPQGADRGRHGHSGHRH
jgi:hypothetical protein